jgi:SAM-dependent methyltransferase
MNRACRLCGNQRLVQVLVLRNSPRNIQRLLEREQIATDQAVTVCVYRCDDCSFVQLVETLESDYYDDYLMAVSHSPQMQAYQHAQSLDFVSRFGLAGKRIIEIGCGDGNYLQYLHQAGAQVYGVEPSRRFQQLARARGFQVIEGYVGREYNIPDSPFDAFVTRQVLEHVPDPNDFLQGIRKALTVVDGVGLVEVPSLEQALENGRFYDFFPDHLNYFSAHTLRFALERNGFQVLQISRGMVGEYNVALVRRIPDDNWDNMQQTLDQITQELRDMVRVYQAQGKRVAVWGSGGKGITAMAVAQLTGIAYAIDSDTNKQGRYMPVSHLAVVAPDKLTSDPVDVVILTALAHRDEIYKELRGTWHFRGVIIVLGPHLQIL